MRLHEPVSGSGTLATITLRGVGNEETALVIEEVLLANRDALPIPVTIEDSEAAQESAQDPSAPATCWPWGSILLGTTAGIVVLFNRRLQKRNFSGCTLPSALSCAREEEGGLGKQAE
jgi:hypothetical protein